MPREFHVFGEAIERRVKEPESGLFGKFTVH